jgi:F-type H+-transporting ATPase subunit delta
MAELATIARPYAEALFKAAGPDAVNLAPQIAGLSALAANEPLRQFADNPKVGAAQVFDLIAGVALSQGLTLGPMAANLLQTVIANGRLSALPEIGAQFQALVNQSSGVADATVQSAFPIDAAQLDEVLAALEKRFGRKLKARVEIVPELIGGIRVIVGDEVLDTSVKARLQQMKVALVA